MATMPMNPAGGGGAPDQGAPAAAPSQAPASPEMMVLAKIARGLQQMAQSNPVLSAGLQKAVQGINEAQSALVSQPQEQPTGNTPPY